MKYIRQDDTIIALSTPLGNGAIAVIRISGEEALSILNPLLKRTIRSTDARKALFNEFISSSQSVVDQIVTTFFKSPASYTGEDVVEISCHCNPLIINRIIDEIIRNDARVAEPGEFTLRAFLNGKMDLSQAEAVAEIINARTRQSLTQSLRHLEGRFSEIIAKIHRQILNNLALLEINLDFSDEEIEVLPVREMAEKMTGVIERIQGLLKTYDYGRLLQEGVKMLILGKPNVGKSSLLNVLLARDRAIVSEIPGTTRDYIEATMEIDGLAVQAVDTAGIRQTEDTVEAIGVQLALAQIESSDIALCLFDAHRPLDDDDHALIKIIQDRLQDTLFVLILNKSDLKRNAKTETAIKSLNLPTVRVSAKTQTNIQSLKRTIKKQLIHDQSMETEEIVVTSARHKQALENTVRSLQNAIAAMEMNASEEIIAVDIRLALDHLGEITGETTSEDVLNHIFANFCIGK